VRAPAEAPAARAGNADLWAGLAWLALSVFLAWQGRDLGAGSIREPGAGFLLFWLGLVMTGFSLSIVVNAVRSGGPSVPSLWAGARWGKVVAVVACLVAYAALFERLGYILATLPLMLLLLRIVDPVRWRVALPLALLSTLGAWWVIKRVLGIQLPSGAFGIG
jgi:putative tricarboxylic transport membrane protein